MPINKILKLLKQMHLATATTAAAFAFAAIVAGCDDLNAVDRDAYWGGTDLHIAVKLGRQSKVRQLLAAGADPNARDNDGATPLYRSLLRRVPGRPSRGYDGEIPLIKQLLDAGADPNISTYFGAAPIDEAKRVGHGAAERLLREYGGKCNLC